MAYYLCMNTLVEKHMGELAVLARRYGVSRLDIFGSAVTEKFEAEHSDLDFLVEFVAAPPPGGMAHAYFGLLHELESVFERPVDLVTDRSIKNPYFRQSVDASRQPVYVS